MKLNLKGILEGTWNSIFVKDSIEKVALERYNVCATCPMNSKFKQSFRGDEYCTACGCNLHLKTRCLSCECPLKKWLAVVSEEEEFIIDKKLKSEQSDIIPPAD